MKKNRILKSIKDLPYSILADLSFTLPTFISCMVSETCSRLKDERDFWRKQYKSETNKTMGMREHIEILEKRLENLE